MIDVLVESTSTQFFCWFIKKPNFLPTSENFSQSFDKPVFLFHMIMCLIQHWLKSLHEDAKKANKLALMGSRNIIWMMFYVSLTPFLIIRGTLAKKQSDHNPRSLDKFLHDYAQKVVKLPSTGTFYDISLRSNYSGMEISYVQW